MMSDSTVTSISNSMVIIVIGGKFVRNLTAFSSQVPCIGGYIINFDYKHHVVRDLAWAIASPPLLVPRERACCWYDCSWYRENYASAIDMLLQLDKDPAELELSLAQQKDRRLGKRFETLWAFWLEKSARFEVAAQNVPLRDGDNTLGELDFLVIDKKTGKYLHLEMAIKFYLGVGDTASQCNWHGPNSNGAGKKDRLDKKVEHLKHKQSVISQRPVVQELLKDMKVRIDACGVILKGRLFYPGGRDMTASGQISFPVDASPEHLRSYWLPMHRFKSSHSNKLRYSPLVDYGWMAGIGQDDMRQAMDKDGLIAAIACGKLRLPLYVACGTDKASVERFFIVSDDWEAAL